MLWQIAVYIRLSRVDGNDESESVVNQKKILEEFLERCFEGQYMIIDFYVDDGLSGTDDSRENYMRMVQDIEAGNVNCVVCKTLSRAFRNYSDQGYYLEYYFPQKNVRFISMGDPKIDTFMNPDVITGLEVPITGLMNDRFAARTSSDVRRTFDHKRRKGEFIGAFPPYGYLKDPRNKNHLVLDENIVPVKRELFSWIVHEGISLNGAAHRMNDIGIPNPSAYKRSLGWNYCNPNSIKNDGLWTGSTVRRIMLDQVNLGHMVQGKQRVVSYKVHDKITVPVEDWIIKEDTHESTFSQDEYEALERVIKRDTRTPDGEHTVHLFSGYMRCKDCDKALQRKHSHGNTYYACRTYTEKSKTRCTKHSIRLDRLECAVLAAIQAQIAQLDSLNEIMDEIIQAPTTDSKNQRLDKLLKEKQRELKKTKALADGLYVDWKSDDITREDYRRMKVQFDKQALQITTAVTALKEEQQRMEQAANSENEVFADIREHSNIQRLDRALLVVLIDKIYVYEHMEIEIVFRFIGKAEPYTFQCAGLMVHVLFCKNGISLGQVIRSYLTARRNKS